MSKRLASMVLALTPMFGCAGKAPPAPQAGLVVESVEPGFAAAVAGIEPGDLLTAWRFSDPASVVSRPPGGDLRSPFELYDLELEEAPRGRIELSGRRGGRDVSFDLATGGWQIKTRPSTLDMAEVLGLAVADTESALDRCRALAVRSPPEQVSDNAIWCGARLGVELAGKRRWQEALTAFSFAGDLAKDVPLWPYPAALSAIQCRAFEANPEHAEALCRKALGERRAAGESSLATAAALNNLAVILGRGERLDAAIPLTEASLELIRRLAPGSVTHAEVMNTAGVMAAIRGEDDRAEQYFERTLEIYEATLAQSEAMASTLGNLGPIRRRQGRLAECVRLYQRSLEIRQRLDGESLLSAITLNNLGVVARQRGDLAMAERHWRESYTLKQRRRPDSLSTVRTLGNLATLALHQGDLEKAEALHRQTLERFEALAPGSRLVGMNLSHLGDIALKRGDADAAESFYRRALAIFEPLSDDNHVTSLNNLGSVASYKGELEIARAYHCEALELLRHQGRDGLLKAQILSTLAGVEQRLELIASAESRYRQALALLDRLAPGSLIEAETLHAMAGLLDRDGRPAQAEAYYTRSLESLEIQVARLGGTRELREIYGASHAGYYKDYLDHLVDTGRDTDAFHVLERYRARSLLEMLAQRDLELEADLPEELVVARGRLHRRVDQARRALYEADEASEAEPWSSRLRDLEEERQRLAERIREATPRLAAVREPEPLTLAQARRGLDEGTLALVYGVTEKDTYLFVVASAASATKPRLVKLGLTRPALRQSVERLRLLIDRSAQDDSSRQALREASRELYGALIAPAEQEVSEARRLLFVPDGPLHGLPFGALVRPASASGEESYLVEWKPLHQVTSLTLYRETLKARHGGQRPWSLAAFGDPMTGHETSEFPRLPGSRDEVLAIAALFGERAVVHLGRTATEERAKTVDPTHTHLHFATHSVLDERFPLSSGLVLTPSGSSAGDNGLLQAWEVFEGRRLDVDLVTLSSCESGLGEERAGEGLIGLSRAFQYAGARSIVASWWSISDISTSALMKRFYKHLLAGASKDEALRSAQVELIRAPVRRPRVGATTLLGWLRGLTRNGEPSREVPFDASESYYWAAFQLIGDWQ